MIKMEETTEIVKDVKNLGIYEKISDIQMELLKKQFQTKKGFHGEFIPLPNMLQKVLPACRDYRLTLYFTSTTEHLILKLHSWDNHDEFSARVRLPPLTKEEKDEGKKITYLKRYLLMDVFQIIENSVDIDETGEIDEVTDVTGEKVQNEPPAVIDKLIEGYKNKNPDKELKSLSGLNGIRMNFLKKGIITKEENEAAYEYIKNHGK